MATMLEIARARYAIAKMTHPLHTILDDDLRDIVDNNDYRYLCRYGIQTWNDWYKDADELLDWLYGILQRRPMDSALRKRHKKLIRKIESHIISN